MSERLPVPTNTFQPDGLTDVFMEPLLDQSSSSFESAEFSFEFSDNNYRCVDYVILILTIPKKTILNNKLQCN